ncbi:hypothetical protein SAMN02910456_01279 [Ruminococcaceae bacterium YRB3002]|nr:hypothetical protein SAMN02910456_01279 [Ruminococcaceae bacterium YRB3002]
MRNYDDIRHLKRPQYIDLPPMPVHDRAAQFSPFAALVGYDDAVAETARLTDSRRDMMEDGISGLNRQLELLEERIREMPPVKVTYFVADRFKEGGSYVTREGAVRRIDSLAGCLVFADGGRVPLADIYSMEFL